MYNVITNRSINQSIIFFRNKPIETDGETEEKAEIAKKDIIHVNTRYYNIFNICNVEGPLHRRDSPGDVH